MKVTAVYRVNGRGGGHVGLRPREAAERYLYDGLKPQPLEAK